MLAGVEPARARGLGRSTCGGFRARASSVSRVAGAAPLDARRSGRRVARARERQPTIPIASTLTDDLPSGAARAICRRCGSTVAPGPATARSTTTIDAGASAATSTIGALSLRVRSAWAIAERWAVGAARADRAGLSGSRRGAAPVAVLMRSRQVALEKRRARVAGPAATSRACATTSRRRAARHLLDVDGAARPAGDEGLSARAQPGGLDPRRRRAAAARARRRPARKLDAQVDAALALAQVALTRRPRRALAYGRRIHTRLAPGRGATHLRADRRGAGDTCRPSASKRITPAPRRRCWRRRSSARWSSG